MCVAALPTYAGDPGTVENSESRSVVSVPSGAAVRDQLRGHDVPTERALAVADLVDDRWRARSRASPPPARPGRRADRRDSPWYASISASDCSSVARSSMNTRPAARFPPGRCRGSARRSPSSARRRRRRGWSRASKWYALNASQSPRSGSSPTQHGHRTPHEHASSSVPCRSYALPSSPLFGDRHLLLLFSCHVANFVEGIQPSRLMTYLEAQHVAYGSRRRRRGQRCRSWNTQSGVDVGHDGLEPDERRRVTRQHEAELVHREEHGANHEGDGERSS